MNAEELIAELYKAEEMYLSPSELWEHRCHIATRYLLDAYAKGRREAMELSDAFAYRRNVDKFVKDVVTQRKSRP